MILALCAAPKMGIKAYMAALPALINRQIEEFTYRAYVTDALQIVTENTAKIFGGKYLEKKYQEAIQSCTEDTRTAEEIIEHIRTGLRRLSGGFI